MVVVFPFVPVDDDDALCQPGQGMREELRVDPLGHEARHRRPAASHPGCRARGLPGDDRGGRPQHVPNPNGVRSGGPGYGPGVTRTPSLADLGDEDYVELTTFRRSGVPVPTPVWVVRDCDALLVTTPSGSGKVKRLRNNADVELRPCTRRGHVEPGASSVSARAEIDADPSAHDRAEPLFVSKYGWRYRAAMVVEGVVRRFRPRPGPDRRIIRITAA